MVACIAAAAAAAARLNGTWQIYRFPNGDANLTRSHAALSLFELGDAAAYYYYYYTYIYHIIIWVIAVYIPTRILHSAAASSSSSSTPPPAMFSFCDAILSFFSHLSPTIIVFLPKFRRSSHAHALIGRAYNVITSTLGGRTTNCATLLHIIIDRSSIILYGYRRHYVRRTIVNITAVPFVEIAHNNILCGRALYTDAI